MEQEIRTTENEEHEECAILVAVETSCERSDETLDELERLAHTAGVVAIARVIQRMKSPNPATFIGSGKAEEISEMIHELDASVVIFDDELTPTQQSNLEKIFGENIKVIDRTALILDIFALHATSREGRLQVRLAQNKYLYPRLRGMWAHLATNRMGGGVGSRFGEGESQLEVDRRIVRKKITKIQRELDQLRNVRNLQRKTRGQSGIFRIALAGYTNAGKSSLLNAICDVDVKAEDLLFATLDSTTRKKTLPQGREVVITDTVGFIQKLPTTLIEAFRSTLDEVSTSNLILHVVDASSNAFESQIDAVHDVFKQISVEEIPCILVFNKIDLLPNENLRALEHRFPDALFVSATTGAGLDALLNRIELAASRDDVLMDILIPYTAAGLLNTAHKHCKILTEEYQDEGISLVLRVPEYLEKEFKKFMK